MGAWALVPVELFWAIWLATIVTGATACRGPICAVTTLDHHAAALLACGVFSVAGLVGLIPTTRGFSRCNGPEVIGLAIATAASGASLLGVAALIIGALILLIIPRPSSLLPPRRLEGKPIMRGLDLLSRSPSSKLLADPELAELSVQINQMWPSLPDHSRWPWTETPMVSIDRSGVPWVIGPAEHDPLQSARGNTVIPHKQRAQLKRIAKFGIPFQRLAIAHELDPQGPVRQLLPALRTPAATLHP